MSKKSDTNKEKYFDGVIYTHHKPKEDYFALKTHGTSMIDKGLLDGAVVIVRKQSCAQSGDIVVALHGDEGIVRVYQEQNGIKMLVSADSKNDVLIITSETKIEIIGKVIESRNYHD